MMSTWFITGASRGFGRELTEQLLARGDRDAAQAGAGGGSGRELRRLVVGSCARCDRHSPNQAIKRGDTPMEAIPGGRARVVGAMIDVAEVDNPPRRLLLGSDAYTLVHGALVDRLAAFEAQQDVAYSTDADDFQRAAT
jgi:NAD(P)-dependent dehydrogenase (short-subunit alcohol dehydrogenase family)